MKKIKNQEKKETRFEKFKTNILALTLILSYFGGIGAFIYGFVKIFNLIFS